MEVEVVEQVELEKGQRVNEQNLLSITYRLQVPRAQSDQHL